MYSVRGDTLHCQKYPQFRAWGHFAPPVVRPGLLEGLRNITRLLTQCTVFRSHTIHGTMHLQLP